MHYVIADPHGEYDRFQRMLERIGFSISWATRWTGAASAGWTSCWT